MRSARHRLEVCLRLSTNLCIRIILQRCKTRNCPYLELGKQWHLIPHRNRVTRSADGTLPVCRSCLRIKSRHNASKSLSTSAGNAGGAGSCATCPWQTEQCPHWRGTSSSPRYGQAITHTAIGGEEIEHGVNRVISNCSCRVKPACSSSLNATLSKWFAAGCRLWSSACFQARPSPFPGNNPAP